MKKKNNYFGWTNLWNMLQQSAVKHTYFLFSKSFSSCEIIWSYMHWTLRINVLLETGTLLLVILQYLKNAGCSIKEKGDTVLTISCRFAASNSARANFFTDIFPTSSILNCLLHWFKLLFDFSFALLLKLSKSFGCTSYTKTLSIKRMSAHYLTFVFSL